MHRSVRSGGGFVWFGTSRMGGGIQPIFFAIFTLAILIIALLGWLRVRGGAQSWDQRSLRGRLELDEWVEREQDD
jgi:hypothetical protein